MERLPKKTSVDKEPDERLFNFRPVLFSAFFLCLGIVFSYFRETKEISPLFVFLPLGVLAAAFLLAQNKKKALAAAFALMLAFSLGATSFSLAFSSYRRVDAVDGYYTVEGRITEKSLGEENGKIRIENLKFDGNEVDGALIAYLPSSLASSLQLSDKVKFSSYVQVNTQAFNDYGFRAEAIAESTRFYAGTVSQLSVTGHEKDRLLAVRQKIGEAVQKGMGETPAGVTLAVLLGDTSAMDEGLLENVRRGGIAHIFAVSGLHIGTLFAVLIALMKKTKLYALPKAVRFLLVLCVLLFYGGVCGYSASVVRATVTCLALYLYRLLGEKSDSLETISFAAICVLLFQPTQLFAVGFQLSFAACYGIAIFSRPLGETAHCLIAKGEGLILQKLFKRPPKEAVDMFERDTAPPSLYELAKRSAIGFLSVSVSAQAFTFPVQLISFGYVSNAGLFLNCLFVPLLSVVFCPLLAFVVAASLLSVFGTAILFVPNVVLSALMLLFEAVDFSSAVSEGASLSAGGVIVYYLFFLCLSDKYNGTRKQKILSAGICAAAFAVCFFAVNL